MKNAPRCYETPIGGFVEVIPLTDAFDRYEMAFKHAVEKKAPNKDLKKIIEKMGYHLSTLALLSKDFDAYSEYVRDFNALKSFETISHKLIPNRDDLGASIHDYLLNFNHDEFKSEKTLGNLIEHRLGWINQELADRNSSTFSIKREFKTKYGFCDFYVGGKFNTLIELKKSAIKRKDLYQCHEFILGRLPKRSKCAILGRSVSDSVIDLAKSLNISVYVYEISEIFPTQIKISHKFGDRLRIMDMMGEFGKFLDPLYESWATCLGWPWVKYNKFDVELGEELTPYYDETTCPAGEGA